MYVLQTGRIVTIRNEWELVDHKDCQNEIAITLPKMSFKAHFKNHVKGNFISFLDVCDF